MHYRKPPPVFTILVSAAFVAYQAGEHLRYLEPSPGQIITLTTATSTASLMFNPTTFAKVESSPPIVPLPWKFELS